MIAVSLKKVDRYEAASLQEMVNVYSTYLESKMSAQLTVKLYDQMLEADILSDLYLLFRKKIEGNADTFLVKLKVSESVLLIYALNHCRDTDNEYAKLVIIKFWNAIDNDLKNRIKSILPRPVGTVKLLSQPPAHE